MSCSKGTISHHLGKGQKEKSRKRRKHSKAVRRQKINFELKNKPCMDCGFVPEDTCQMDFDHREGVDKIDNVNRLVKNGTWEQIYAEIEKCDLVCANCHRLRTQKRIKAKYA